MPKLTKTLLLIFVAAGLFAPPLARAEFVSSSAPLQLVGAPAAPAVAALDFLSQAVNRDAALTDDRRASSLVSAFELPQINTDGRAYRLNGVGQLIEPPAQLRGDNDLFLWTLLGLVNAQKQGRQFDLVDGGADFVVLNHKDKLAPVPLPGAIWLFVMGLLGLAGTRLTGGSSKKAQADQRENSPSLGGLVPA